MLIIFALPLSWLFGVVIPPVLVNIFWYGFQKLGNQNLVNLSFGNNSISNTSLTDIYGNTFILNFNFDWNSNLTLKAYAVMTIIGVFIIVFSTAVAFSRKLFIIYNFADTNLSSSLEYILYFLLSIVIIHLIFCF